MTRLFKLKNKARNAWWVMAVNYNDAVKLSLTIRYAHKPENISLIGDFTDSILQDEKRQTGEKESLKKLLNENSRGFGGILVHPPQPNEWLCSWPMRIAKPQASSPS